MSTSNASLILFNANVLTLDPAYPKVRLVAIRGDKILGLGDDSSLHEFRDYNTEVIDCQGMTVLPGFNDAHCHLTAFAESLLILNLGSGAVSSICDIQTRIRDLAREMPPGNWVRGGGCNEFYLDEKRLPTRWELDEATVAHPVKLTHRSGYAHVLNSSALLLVGISRETADPPGGIIERDLETGEPNGVLYGMGAYLAEKVPSLSNSELDQGIQKANERLLSSGIVSVQDASPRNDSRRWQLFRSWKDRGFLKPRIRMMLGAEAFDLCQKQGFPLKEDDDQLQLGGIKIILNEVTGRLNPTRQDLEQKVLEIHKSGFQIALHAIEETTIEAACSALEYALERFPRMGHRHRLEHCSVCTPVMARRLAALGVVVVTQPSFVYYNGERYLEMVPA